MPEITEAQVREVAPLGVWRAPGRANVWHRVAEPEDVPEWETLGFHHLTPEQIAEAIRQKPCGTCGGKGTRLQPRSSHYRDVPANQMVVKCRNCTNGLLPPAEPELRPMIEGLVG